MAARKTTRKKTARKKSPARKSTARGGANLARRIDKELSDLSKQIDRRLKPLRLELEKAERRAGTRASQVLREVRKRLNEVELSGDSELQKFLRRRRRELSAALTELSKTVRPHRKATRSRARSR